ncbi:hypothetical protein [Rhodococcus rhodochrous]|uniref:Secreted protein n=1 Tax=Rhodococcus rhodochrous TaxID=1829 RepID=A0AAW4XGS6_RHORH|nr:hypothetical protein [Rhodococcus rhodochrous]MCD2112203.1 hypothetical protein [Rhodococcus rhodochrous]
MTIAHRILSAAAAGLMGVAVAVTAPGVAGAQEPCQLSRSNTGPRTCEMTQLATPPVLTLGDGICAGIVRAGGTAFDGPLDESYAIYSVAGATHGIELRITQGYSLLGEWTPSILNCDVTVAFDWHNLDTGARGTETRFVPAFHTSTRPLFMHVFPGPGRVALTMRTERPSIPVTTEVFVP